QHAEFPVVINRFPGFAAQPFTFSAKGGQLAAKEEGRTRVYAEFTPKKGDEHLVVGSIHSKILTNLGKHRVDVTIVGVNPKDGRRVALLRTFDLEIRSAFAVAAEPSSTKL